MSIQPGIGYDIVSTPEGESLVINFPDDLGGGTLEQFQVELAAGGPVAKVRIAQGRVITQDVWEGASNDATTVEYGLTGVWAYPAGSKIAGTDITSAWMDSGGTITIPNAAEEGSNYWGVYIVRQPFNKGSQKHTPELIVINDDYMSPSDAYTKTTPWGEAGTTDSIRMITVAAATSLTVDGSPAGSIITGFDPTPSQYNYNCQRVKVASIVWDTGTSSWTVIQHLIGTLTLPNIIQYYGTQIGVDGARPDTYWPNYESQCDDWNGAWSGYTKESLPTAGVILPIGFPA